MGSGTCQGGFRYRIRFLEISNDDGSGPQAFDDFRLGILFSHKARSVTDSNMTRLDNHKSIEKPFTLFLHNLHDCLVQGAACIAGEADEDYAGGVSVTHIDQPAKVLVFSQ